MLRTLQASPLQQLSCQAAHEADRAQAAQRGIFRRFVLAQGGEGLPPSLTEWILRCCGLEIMWYYHLLRSVRNTEYRVLATTRRRTVVNWYPATLRSTNQTVTGYQWRCAEALLLCLLWPSVLPVVLKTSGEPSVLTASGLVYWFGGVDLVSWDIMILSANTDPNINPLAAKLSNWNFHSELTKWRSTFLQILLI